jgi:hypothetical protein
MLPNPQMPTPAERPPPPLLIGVLLSDENVCSQFNPVSENVAQGKMAEKVFSRDQRGKRHGEPTRLRLNFKSNWRRAGLGCAAYFTINLNVAEWLRLPEVPPVTVIV